MKFPTNFPEDGATLTHKVRSTDGREHTSNEIKQPSNDLLKAMDRIARLINESGPIS